MADLWVSGAGSDSNSGTQNSPLRTLQKAADIVNAGTTVHVMPGTYAQQVTFRRGGTSGSRVVFKSEGKWDAKVTVPSGAGSIFTINDGVQYIDIVDFLLYGVNGGSSAYGILIYGSYNRIIGNHIRDIYGNNGGGHAAVTAISLGVWTDTDHPRRYNEAWNNVIHHLWNKGNLADPSGVGIYLQWDHNHAYNNLIYNMKRCGIQVNHRSGSNEVINNTVCDVQCADGAGGHGIMIAVADSPAIAADGIIVANNILVDNSKGITQWESDPCTFGAGNICTHNQFYGNGTAFDASQVVSNKLVNSSPITTDPKFVSKVYNGIDGDFSLQADSTAIDGASAAYATSADIRDYTRTTPDVGAYEYGGTPVTPPPEPPPATTLTKLEIAGDTTIQVGEIVQWGITATFSDDSTATWPGDAVDWVCVEGTPHAATINSYGAVTGVAAGSNTFYAQSGSVKSTNRTITVSASITQIEIVANNAVMNVGQTQQIYLSQVYSTGLKQYVQAETWASDKSTKISVTSGGLLTALAAENSVTITATFAGLTTTAQFASIVSAPAGGGGEVISFLEVQFPPEISYGCVGGPEFNTIIAEAGGGWEQRNVQWSEARGKWDATQGLKTQEQLDVLVAFFRNCYGRAIGFRFKDWMDYRALAVTLEEVSTGVYQLRKSYTTGTQTVYRKIVKPVQNTIKLYDGGVLVDLGNYTVDYTTGLVTYTGSGTVTADFQFDVPARFDTDHFASTIEFYNTHTWNQIPIVEIRL